MDPVPIAELVREVEIPYEEFTLDNGLRVIVHEDRKAPVVAVSIWSRRAEAASVDGTRRTTPCSVYDVLMHPLRLLPLSVLVSACVSTPSIEDVRPPEVPYVVVLGIAQDGGYPQAGCNRPHCEGGWSDVSLRREVASLAIVDPISDERWLIDATPDFPVQLRRLDELTSSASLRGIFLTHAHIGHYTGLMHLGREVMGASGVPVFAMPRMRRFLRENGPWSQLVELENIELTALQADVSVRLNERLTITPIPVPHRDEFSETVGYLIRGPSRSVFYLPDIDKWERWERPVEEIIEQVDVAYLDATFYDGNELGVRDMSLIPHPFIVESIERFSSLAPEMRQRVRFIHLNHSNPALDPDSAARRVVLEAGMSVAEQGEIVALGE